MSDKASTRKSFWERILGGGGCSCGVEITSDEPVAKKGGGGCCNMEIVELDDDDDAGCCGSQVNRRDNA